MKRLLILGAGQYGMVAKEIAQLMNEFDEIEFLDDNSEMAIGKIDDVKHLEYDAIFIAIGNSIVRKHLMNQLDKIVTLIHPSAIIMPSAKIGEGSIVEGGAVISSGAEIGNGTIVMANAVVGHNAIVGDFCQLKYNCSVSERSNVPNQTILNCNVVYSV